MTEIVQNAPHVFYCKGCDYTCRKESVYIKHTMTRKHQSNPTDYIYNPNDTTCKCGKIYKHRQGLWTHKQKCEYSNDKEIETNKEKNIIDLLVKGQELLITENIKMKKENEDFKNIIIEFMKTNKDVIEVCKNNSTNISNNGPTSIGNNNTITTTNNTFNLQLFLNEKCKDAMNIGEFVDSFDIQLDELEDVGRVGYIDGLSRIITNRLKDLDVYKRPFHCSDLKRETMYVKDQNKWEKEEKSNPKLRKAIRAVSQKNMVKVVDWRDANPACRSSLSPLNDQFIKIVRQANGGIGEIADSEDKIMHRIAKEVGIDKK